MYLGSNTLSQYLRSLAAAVGLVAQKGRPSMEGAERGLSTRAKSDSDSALTPPTKKTKRIFDFNKSVKHIEVTVRYALSILQVHKKTCGLENCLFGLELPWICYSRDHSKHCRGNQVVFVLS